MDAKTVEKTNQLLSERDNANRPIWVRSPRSGQTEFFSGLSKGKLYQLEQAGVVRTASLRPKGAIRGVKLFHLQSLLDYLESCAAPLPNQAQATQPPVTQQTESGNTKQATLTPSAK